MTDRIEGAPESLSTRAFCRIEFVRNKNFQNVHKCPAGLKLTA